MHKKWWKYWRKNDGWKNFLSGTSAKVERHYVERFQSLIILAKVELHYVERFQTLVACTYDLNSSPVCPWFFIWKSYYCNLLIIIYVWISEYNICSFVLGVWRGPVNRNPIIPLANVQGKGIYWPLFFKDFYENFALPWL